MLALGPACRQKTSKVHGSDRMTGVIVDEWGTARTDGMRWLIPPIQEHTDQPEYLS